MLIIGCDFHLRFPQIALVDWWIQKLGEFIGHRLEHRNDEAKKFYAELQKPVRVGMEATAYAHWFELGHELWIGDAAVIRAMGSRASRRRSRGMHSIFSICCCKIVFSGSGFLRRPGFSNRHLRQHLASLLEQTPETLSPGLG
jgi:hypothetical protein